ncbi:hypothetical protein Hanom_Chr11g00990871 [Helianthus anomalus]
MPSASSTCLQSLLRPSAEETLSVLMVAGSSSQVSSIVASAGLLTRTKKRYNVGFINSFR